MYFNTFDLLITVTSFGCIPSQESHCDCFPPCYRKFSLIEKEKRSIQPIIYADNTQTLMECIDLAFQHKGLALNYQSESLVKRSLKVARNFTWNLQSHWQLVHLYFNCHVLQCPENVTMGTLVRDINFNYFSLYQQPIVATNYICVPEIGVFILNTDPVGFRNASLNCFHTTAESCVSLAHVASEKRTKFLSKLLKEHNQQHFQQNNNRTERVHLAYVDLQYNRTRSPNKMEFFNSMGESLDRIPYRAWEPGSPKASLQLINASCVALTIRSTWLTVDCQRKLPYICEIFTSSRNN
uniref:C-type lectin domain-containing protein n=1 Tax=Glossina palpalis gambiensis TaxID=67801 RepID=A0A1B0B6H2_9MUSC